MAIAQDKDNVEVVRRTNVRVTMYLGKQFYGNVQKILLCNLYINAQEICFAHLHFMYIIFVNFHFNRIRTVEVVRSSNL